MPKIKENLNQKTPICNFEIDATLLQVKYPYEKSEIIVCD